MDQRSFRFLWMGQSLANIGDVFYIIGVIQLINMLTGSVLAITLVPFFITTAMFISGFLTPLLIDRLALKPLLVYSQLGKTIILLGLSLFSNSPFSIFVIILFVGFLDGCATPVRNALIPYYIPTHRLVKANGFLATLDQTIRLGGWPVGGIIMVWLGTTDFLWLVFVFFAVGAVMMVGLEPIEKEKQEDAQKNIWGSIKEGWLILRHHPVLKILTMMDILETIASVVWIAAIMYVYVDDVLGVSEAWWGYINGAFFGGLMLGGLFALKGDRLIARSPKVFIIMGLIGSTLVTFIFGVSSEAIVALVFSVFIGVFQQLKDISQQTIVQTSVEKSQLAKVYSAQGTLMTGLFGVASLSMGAVADHFGVRFIFFMASGFLALTLFIAVLNRKAFVIREG